MKNSNLARYIKISLNDFVHIFKLKLVHFVKTFNEDD